MEDDIFGKSVVKERPHFYKRITVNGAMAEGAQENILGLCFSE